MNTTWRKNWLNIGIKRLNSFTTPRAVEIDMQPRGILFVNYEINLLKYEHNFHRAGYRD